MNSQSGLAKLHNQEKETGSIPRSEVCSARDRGPFRSTWHAPQVFHVIRRPAGPANTDGSTKKKKNPRSYGLLSLSSALYEVIRGDRIIPYALRAHISHLFVQSCSAPVAIRTKWQMARAESSSGSRRQDVGRCGHGEGCLHCARALVCDGVACLACRRSPLASAPVRDFIRNLCRNRFFSGAFSSRGPALDDSSRIGRTNARYSRSVAMPWHRFRDRVREYRRRVMRSVRCWVRRSRGMGG